jgi:hypothetical protein
MYGNNGGIFPVALAGRLAELTIECRLTKIRKVILCTSPRTRRHNPGRVLPDLQKDEMLIGCAPARRKVVFVIDPRWEGGSTLLRAQQLCQLCRWVVSGQNVSFSLVQDATRVADSTLVLTKSYLAYAPLLELEKHRQRGNRIYADYLDLQVNPAQVALVDTLIASSQEQNRFFLERFPEKRIRHVTHHVDLRIPDIALESGDFRCGYFGQPSNAGYLDRLDEVVDMIDATNPKDTSWIDKLPSYPCHYAIRKAQQWDGFKPFLKGFIAAHCSAVVVVSASDREATSYLGKDYPFCFSIEDGDDAKAAMEKVKRSYRSAEWHRALETMQAVRQRSSPGWISQELLRLFVDNECSSRTGRTARISHALLDLFQCPLTGGLPLRSRGWRALRQDIRQTTTAEARYPLTKARRPI